MSALAAAQRNYDRLIPEDFETEDVQDWPPSQSQLLTDEEIESFIAEFANDGGCDDDLGKFKDADPIYLAIAQIWVKDKAQLVGNIGPKFWAWAKAAAHLREFGRD